MIRVSVLGALGKMGATTCNAISGDPELELVAALDVDDALDDMLEEGAEVCVDFTRPDAVKGHVLWLLAHGVHAVVGTTGLGPADLREIEAATGPANAIVAPNFAIGAVLLMELCRLVAPHMPHAEIIEQHHDQKLDAPSGTALRTAALISEARGRDAPQPCGPAGHPARGYVEQDVAVHSVRLPGLVAHQEVVFGGLGQTLTIRHDSTDRSSFMPGVLLAVKGVADRPGLTVGLDHLLF